MAETVRRNINFSLHLENGSEANRTLSWTLGLPTGSVVKSIKLEIHIGITARVGSKYAYVRSVGYDTLYLREYNSGTYTTQSFASSAISSYTFNFRADTTVAVDFTNAVAIITYEPGYSASTVDPVTVEAGASTTFTIHNTAHSVLNHKIRVVFGTQSVTAATMDTGDEESDAWTVPIEWLTEFTDSGSAYGTIYCDTYSGSTKVGTTSAAIQIMAPQSAAPEVTLTATHPLNEGVPWDMYLQTLSGVVLTAQVRPQYSATATDIVFSDGIVDPQNRYEATIGSLGSSGTNTFTVTVRDSRGLVSTASVSINVVPYSSPTFENVSILRCDQNGNTTDQQGNPLDTGTYVLALADVLYSSCENNNVLSIALDVDVDGVWVPVDSLTDNVAKVCSAPPTSDFPAGFDPGTIYAFRIRAVDSLNRSVTRTMFLQAEAIFMHIRDDETGMALGMVSRRAGLEVNPAWPFYVYNAELMSLLVPEGIVLQLDSTKDPNTIYPGTTWTQLSTDGSVTTWQRTA